jgi:polysaccharide biosynthesis/export protein
MKFVKRLERGGQVALATAGLTLMLVFAPAATGRLAAQDALPAVPEAQVIERLRASGLTRSQVRDRLQQMGRDPAIADRYFDLMESNTPAPTAAANPQFLEAMEQIGVTLRGAVPLRADTIISTEAAAAASASTELPVFGRDLFRIATSQFQHVGAGPVDPDYRLGVGDQILVVLTGDVEMAHTVEVTREGMIMIPDVGQLMVAGLTVRELEDRLYERLGRVYSGVGRGAGASTQFSLSLGQLRTNQIFLVGEVERPGAYQVSSVATVFNALYLARGPNDNGSFRRIEVRRRGQVVRTIDVYDYLLRGDSRDDIRLEQGDVIFVPLVGPQVAVQGEVRRPAWFELRPGEGFRHVIAFAGGLRPNASMARIQIDRIVPAEQRRPGTDRVLIDVDTRAALSGTAALALQDNDQISVFSVLEERRNRITVVGGVRRPGLYEWSAGTRLWEVIDRAEGLEETAYTARAHVFRLNEEDGTRSLVHTPLFVGGSGRRNDVPLADRDSVVIFSRAELRNPEQVSIAGFVRRPGVYTLSPGMTARDLILAAGGFVQGADDRAAELARLPDPIARTNQTAQIIHIPLAMSESAGGRRVNGAAAPDWVPGQGEVELTNGDAVFIRRAPGYEGLRTVHLAGEVMRPGGYALQQRGERLLDVLQRSGGLTSEAYGEGLRVVREGRLVSTDLAKAQRNPRSRFNFLLEAGDSIYVPSFDGTVLVAGAVTFETRVLYQPGLSLADYVSRAGGYAPRANKGRVSVTHPSGERHTVGRAALFRSSPRVPPGSTVFVPLLPDDERTDWGEVLTRGLSVMTSTLTLIIAIDRLGR